MWFPKNPNGKKPERDHSLSHSRQKLLTHRMTKDPYKDEECINIVWRIKRNTLLKFYYRDSYETTAIKPHKLKSFYVESISRFVSVRELTCHPGPGATLSTFRRSTMTLAHGNSGEIFWTTKSDISSYDGLNDRKIRFHI